MLKMMKRSSYEYSAIINQIGKVRRIATLSASHNGPNISIKLHVATVERPLNTVGDYMLGSFSDSIGGKFYFESGQEQFVMNDMGLRMHQFVSELDEMDRQGINFLLSEYAKESYAPVV